MLYIDFCCLNVDARTCFIGLAKQNKNCQEIFLVRAVNQPRIFAKHLPEVCDVFLNS